MSRRYKGSDDAPECFFCKKVIDTKSKSEKYRTMHKNQSCAEGRESCSCGKTTTAHVQCAIKAGAEW